MIHDDEMSHVDAQSQRVEIIIGIIIVKHQKKMMIFRLARSHEVFVVID